MTDQDQITITVMGDGGIDVDAHGADGADVLRLMARVIPAIRSWEEHDLEEQP